MNIIKAITNYFKKPVEDSYLEYLNRETKFVWEAFGTEKGAYFCKAKNFYIERGVEGRVKATRDFDIMHKQTISGPYCRWFFCDEYYIHKYFR